MVFSKIKKIIFILLILFILLFPFWCVRGLCSEPDNYSPFLVDGISVGNNAFVSGRSVTTFFAEAGYIYHVWINSGSFERPTVYSSSYPSVGVPFNLLLSTSTNEFEFDYPSYNDVYITINGDLLGTVSRITVTREKLTGINFAVNDLVDNVGIGQIWDIFDISINYIVVVVLFAFGAYIIFRIIRKISRGKEGL